MKGLGDLEGGDANLAKGLVGLYMRGELVAFELFCEDHGPGTSRFGKGCIAGPAADSEAEAAALAARRPNALSKISGPLRMQDSLLTGS